MDLHKCDKCNKEYKSYQSLWNHKKRIHTDTEIIVPVKKTEITTCDMCYKNFSSYKCLNRHQKTCKKSPNIVQENEELKNKIKTIEQELAEFKQQMLQLMNNKFKVHPKTIQKINKMLTNNGTINNTTNNINIIALGKENLTEILSQKEKMTILNNKHNCLNYIVEYIHFNDKFPQFKNIAITNIKNKYAYKFDQNMSKFIAISKEELINEIIEQRAFDIEEFFAEYKDKLADKTKEIIKNFLDNISDENEYFENKKEQIKVILYNNKDKITIDE